MRLITSATIIGMELVILKRGEMKMKKMIKRLDFRKGKMV